jgi:hypothetical protein
MARTSRFRTRERISGIGSATGTWIIPINDIQHWSSKESCSDAIGAPVTDSSFKLDRVDKSGVSGLSGTSTGGPWKIVMDRYPSGLYTSAPFDHIGTGAPTFTSKGATILARTNPSRPTIVPFTIVQDLHDIPRMLRDVGKLIRTPKRLLSPKEQANSYLGAKFGWLPLIDDAVKLLHLQQYIGARARELQRLYNGQGLRRKITLDSYHGNEHFRRWAMWSQNWTNVIYGDVSVTTRIREWGTVRWKPTSLPFPGWHPSDVELNQKAIQLALGLTTEGVMKGAWDVLPWTWLIDWFTNASDFLSINSSTIPASPANINTMRTTVTLGQHTLVSDLPTGVRDGGGQVVHTTLERAPGLGSLTASLPTLDASRLSVLGALFIQRFK